MSYSTRRTVVLAEGLSKRYRIGARPKYNTLRETLNSCLKAPLRAATTFLSRAPVHDQPGDPYIWALKDVSFRIERGEVVGIVGQNGAGKSTLLSVLCRITEPTKGQAAIYGRVASLLEVGTGFHPELTGRDNIYLSGAILGMRRAEIDRKFDEIVAFAEIDRFIDTRVKWYSSGMYVRLAFAVAAHLEPEILLVDEVLAVGDASFQKKCLARMGEVAHEGRTILFVSHNTVAIQALCSRAICIESGRIIADDRPSSVVMQYLRSPSPTPELLHATFHDAPGNDYVKLRRACIRAADDSAGPITVRTPLVLEFEYWNLIPGATLEIALNLYNDSGILVFGTGTVDAPPAPAGLIRSSCRIPGDLLNNNLHRVELSLVGKNGEVVLQKDDVLVFDVMDSAELRGSFYDHICGAVRPNLEWTTDVLEEQPQLRAA